MAPDFTQSAKYLLNSNPIYSKTLHPGIAAYRPDHHPSHLTVPPELTSCVSAFQQKVFSVSTCFKNAV